MSEHFVYPPRIQRAKSKAPLPLAATVPPANGETAGRLGSAQQVYRSTFTVPLSNVVSGKLIEVEILAVPPKEERIRNADPAAADDAQQVTAHSAVTVEGLKRSVARRWKEEEDLRHVPWQAVEILVSETGARRLVEEADVARSAVHRVVSGDAKTDHATSSTGGAAQTSGVQSADAAPHRLESPAQSESESELVSGAESSPLIPLMPDTLEFKPNRFAELLTAPASGSSDAGENGVTITLTLHFFVRGFARFESRKELLAALRTVRAAAECTAWKTTEEGMIGVPDARDDEEEDVVVSIAIDERGYLSERNNQSWKISPERGLERVNTDCMEITLLEHDPEALGDSRPALREYITDGSRRLLQLPWPAYGYYIVITRDDVPRVLAGGRAVEETYGPLSMWDVSGVEDLSYLFAEWWQDFAADISGWNVSGVRSMACMFQECYKFNSNLAEWDVSSVRNFEGMFLGCYSFNMPLGSWNVQNSEDMRAMFFWCESLTPASVSTLESWAFELSSVWRVGGMFYGCKQLQRTDSLPSWLTPFSMYAQDGRFMFGLRLCELISNMDMYAYFIDLEYYLYFRRNHSHLLLPHQIIWPRGDQNPDTAEPYVVYFTSWEIDEIEEMWLEAQYRSDWGYDEYDLLPACSGSRRGKLSRNSASRRRRLSRNNGRK